MANQSYYIKGFCEGWDCVGHCVDDEDVHIVRKPSGTELQLCSSCLADYRKDYPAPNMPENFQFYYRCFCCGYLVSDTEYESAYVFEHCPRCHVGVENFVPEAHLTPVAADDAYCACQPAAVLWPRIAQDCPKCGKPHRR